MGKYTKELASLFATDTFIKIINAEPLRAAEISAAVALLIKAGISFDLSFAPGTRRIATSASLTIFINPTTTLKFIIPFEGGSTFL